MTEVERAPLGRDEARTLTDRIQRLVADAANVLAELSDAINEAYRREAWRALSYTGWSEYVAGEFGDGGTLPRLDPDERREFVRFLRSLGTSTRAIGSVAGVGRSTVARDLAAVPSGTPAVRYVVGLDGKRYEHLWQAAVDQNKVRQREREQEQPPVALLIYADAAIAKIKKEAETLFGLAQQPRWTEVDRTATVESVEQVIARLGVVRDALANPGSTRFSDEEAQRLLGNDETGASP